MRLSNAIKTRKLATVVAAALAIVLLVWGALIWVPTARRAARLDVQAMRFQSIALGMRVYDEWNHHMVQEHVQGRHGDAPCSWRVPILDCMEGGGYSSVPGVPLDDPKNQKFLAVGRSWYCFSRAGHDPPNTHIFAVTGRGTAFDHDRRCRFQDLPPHLILLVETGHSNTPWWKPGDLDVDSVHPSLTEGSDGTGVLVAFANGEVWLLEKTTPLEDLKKFFTIDGAKKWDREAVLRRYAAWTKP